MGLHSEEYQQLVLNDLKNLEGLSHPVKASLPERLFVRKTSTDNLHPNPKDEFSDPKIGPNSGHKSIRRRLHALKRP